MTIWAGGRTADVFSLLLSVHIVWTAHLFYCNHCPRMCIFSIRRENRSYTNDTTQFSLMSLVRLLYLRLCPFLCPYLSLCLCSFLGRLDAILSLARRQPICEITNAMTHLATLETTSNVFVRDSCSKLQWDHRGPLAHKCCFKDLGRD